MTTKKNSNSGEISERLSKNKEIPILLLLLTLFLTITFLVTSETSQSFDTSITKTLSNSLNQTSYLVTRSVTFLGSYYFLAPATLIATIVFYWYDRKTLALVFFLFLLSTSILCTSLKFLFARPRPLFSVFSYSSGGYSYPSGHTMGAFSFFIGLYFFTIVKGKETQNNLFLALASFTALLVGLSRMFLGVHYLTDVIGGYLSSGILLIIFSLLYDKLNQKQ